MKSRFIYASWHYKNQSWQVQRKGYPSPGSARTELGAAKLASKAWGIPVRRLLVRRLLVRNLSASKKPKEFKQSRYAIAYWHTTRRYWYAQAKPAEGGLPWTLQFRLRGSSGTSPPRPC